MFLWVWAVSVQDSVAGSLMDVILAQHPRTRLTDALDLAEKKKARGDFGLEQRTIEAAPGQSYRSTCKWSPLGQTECLYVPTQCSYHKSTFFDQDKHLYRMLTLRLKPLGFHHELTTKYSKALDPCSYQTASFHKDLSFWPRSDGRLVRQLATLQADHYSSRRTWNALGQETEVQTFFRGGCELWIEKEYLNDSDSPRPETGAMESLIVSYKNESIPQHGTQLMHLRNKYKDTLSGRAGLLQATYLNGEEIMTFMYNKLGNILQLVNLGPKDWIAFRETTAYFSNLGGGITGFMGGIAFDQDFKMKNGVLHSEVIEVNGHKMKKHYTRDQECRLVRETSEWADIRYFYNEAGWMTRVQADTPKGRVVRTFVRKDRSWVIETEFGGKSSFLKVRFDAAGNMIQRGSKHFTIGPQARVIEVRDTEQPDRLVQYQYDESGWRIRKQVAVFGRPIEDSYRSGVIDVTPEGLLYLLRVEQQVVGWLRPSGMQPRAFDRTGTPFSAESLWWQASSYGPWLAEIMEPGHEIAPIFRGAVYDEDLEAYAFEKRDFDPFLLRYQSPHDSIFREEVSEANEATLLFHLEGEMYNFSRSNPTFLQLNPDLD